MLAMWDHNIGRGRTLKKIIPVAEVAWDSLVPTKTACLSTNSDYTNLLNFDLDLLKLRYVPYLNFQFALDY